MCFLNSWCFFFFRQGDGSTVGRTKGNVGACRFLLQEEGLLGFFEKVFGMLGQFYGESEFDQENKQPSELEGAPDCQLPDMKVNLIQALMSQAGLSTNEAALVEDAQQR